MAECLTCGSPLPDRSARAPGHRGGRDARFCGARCRREGYRAGIAARESRSHRGNPGTSDRLYSEDEVEWLKAVERWRRLNGYRIPDCRETLSIARELGYRKGPP